MKAATIIQSVVTIILLIVTISLWQQVNILEKQVQEVQEPDVYMVMGQMQQQVHKLMYSLDQENFSLADFYLHELEEATETLVDANVMYHDQPVGELTKSMLAPVLVQLEESVDNQDIVRTREKASLFVQSCNNCHMSTGNGEIVVTERAESTPFNQRFERVE